MLELTVDYPDDDAYWNRKFARSIGEVTEWQEKAASLLMSLEAIRPVLVESWKSLIDAEIGERSKPELKIHGTYLMLAAYAIENLLKASIVRSRGWSVEELEKALPKEIKSHDLVALSQSAGIAFTVEGKELLARQSTYSTWAGRYPAPIKVGDLRPRVLPTGTLETLLTWRGADIRMTEQIVAHLQSVLDGSGPSTGGGDAVERAIEPWERLVIKGDITPWGGGKISGTASR